jgi:hypothetical protein
MTEQLIGLESPAGSLVEPTKTVGNAGYGLDLDGTMALGMS